LQPHSTFYAEHQGRRSSGRAGGGAAKELRPRETYKKQKIVTNCACFCSLTILTSKIIENYCEVSGCANSCNKFVWIRSLWTTNWPMILLWKGTSALVAPLRKGRGQCSRHSHALWCHCWEFCCGKTETESVLKTKMTFWNTEVIAKNVWIERNLRNLCCLIYLFVIFRFWIRCNNALKLCKLLFASAAFTAAKKLSIFF